MNQDELELYKYLPPERVDVLEGEQIAFTPPSRFNDPFDLHPTVATVTDKSFLRKKAIETEKELKLRPPKGMFPGRKAERKAMRELRKGFIKEMVKNAETFASDTQKGLSEVISENFGVLCLSSVKDSLLMWAHYAASHEGFLIQLRTDHQAVQALGKLHQIAYSANRPVYDPRIGANVDIYLGKSPEWKYEEEYRIIRHLIDCPSPTQKNGKTLFLYSLPRSAVKAAYLGVRTPPPIRERLLSVAKAASIAVFQTKLKRGHFALEFEQIL